MRKLLFAYAETKAQNISALFSYINGTVFLPPVFEISSLWSSSVVVQPGLCRGRSEMYIGLFMRWLYIYHFYLNVSILQKIRKQLWSPFYHGLSHIFIVNYAYLPFVSTLETINDIDNFKWRSEQL